MPESWIKYKLGEITKWRSGGTPPKMNSEYWNGSIPWISAKSLKGRYVDNSELKISDAGLKRGSKLALTGSILLLVRGSGLYNDIPVAMASKDVAYNQDVKCIVPSIDDLSNMFLLYWFKGNKVMLSNMLEATSIGAGKFDMDRLFDLDVKLPSMEEQKAIASILSALDDKIELNLQMNKTLEEMAMALYKHWFVDFGPFQNGKFIDSELGMIPEGWEVKSIYDLIDVIFGAPFKSKIFNEDKKGYPLIRIRDLKFGKPQYYTEENHIKKTVIRKGDILAGMDALFVPYSWSGEEGVMNQRVVFFKPKYNTVKRRFVYEAVKPWLKFYEGAKVGTTVIHLSKSDIDTFTIIYPNDHQILNSFNEQIEPLHEQIISNNIEIDHLTILRDTLLPKLISGEVRVKEFQQLVEASL